jgi:phage baseplate assembly protein W
MISNITSSKYPIGLTLPIVNGSGGYFQQSFDTNTQVKSNLSNFLKTRRGERRMMPEFGTKLYTVLFEQRDENVNEIVKNLLREEIGYWIPEVRVDEISIINTENSEDGDNYKLRISLDFTVIQTNQKDTLDFELENIKI